MLCLLGSVAELERAIIRERQAEGIAKAKARGVYKGRAKVLDEEQIMQARTWVREGIPKAHDPNPPPPRDDFCASTAARLWVNNVYTRVMWWPVLAHQLTVTTRLSAQDLVSLLPQ